ncbi:unnamed protein product [Euphydryas editha]|uniref:Uncharacterized protein n=1 Tax=Euphydryas editha TaxID=104508 RepID=A0AAU9U0Z7_EUPED|nr:unnamed protein product [Euphydryas editha]
MAYVEVLSRNPNEPAITDAYGLDELDVETDNWLTTAHMADEDILTIKDTLSDPIRKKYETVVAIDKIRPLLNLNTDLGSSTSVELPNDSSDYDNED